MNILWDFDGTLFNTYPAYTEIFYKVLGGTSTREQIYQKLKISFSHATRFFGLSNEQIKEINSFEGNITPEDVKPFKHVEDILKFATTNVIMTHKTKMGVDEILNYYGWEHYFKEIVTIDNGYPRKPHPASYQYLHDKHHLNLIIGDRELDILPGKSLGIKTCLFQNNTPGADYYLNDYIDFFKIIAQKY